MKYALPLVFAFGLLLTACDLTSPEKSVEQDSKPSVSEEIPAFNQGTDVSVPSGDASVSPSGAVEQNATASVPVADGWNLVSVPLESTSTFGEDFPMCSSGFLYEAGQGYNSISESDSLPAGRGAFLNCSEGTATIDGTSPSPSVSLDEGWNLIGALDEAVSTDNLNPDPSGILETSFYAYDPSGGYTAADSLRTGNGYWVKASASGSLQFPTSSETLTITFNPKTVGDTLYAGGYSGKLDYTVSTGDTTFTASGSVTAEVPIADGDSLEISHSDTEYLSTLAVNNTDSEPKPFNAEGFPAEPDYQNTVVTIAKENLVGEYQIVGFPATSPDGHSTADEYIPHINNSRRFTEQVISSGDTLSRDKIYIVEHDSSWNEKATTAVSNVRETIPFPTTDPVMVESEDALSDSIDARDLYNFTSLQGGSNGNNGFYDGNYLQASKSWASGGTGLKTTMSEFYSAISDFRNANGQDIKDTIFDDDGSLDTEEAAFPVQILYHTVSGSSIE